MRIAAIFLFVLIVLTPLSANAYIGPGVGAGTIGVVLGIILAGILALFSILWFPIKRLFKKKEKPSAGASENDSTKS